ncbi:MAG: hypothetical protein V3V33_05580 [Candidatus Lokiarchaeia archaeon]
MRTNQLFIEFKTELLKIKDKKKFEKAYYEKLRKCLKAGKFIAFELLFNASVDFNLFIDIKKIPDRLNIISKLLLNCTDKVSTGYHTSALGEIIDILRFCKKYQLLEKELSILEKKTLKNLKKDTLFLANLNDLFGKVSNSFILYIYSVIPQDLYNYFITSPISFFPDRDELVHYIKNIFFDQYTIYGLSVRNLSTIDDFMKVFKENYPYDENQLKKQELLIGKGKELIEFNVTYRYRMFYYDTEEEHEHQEIKKHLISPSNIMKNLNKILMKRNYNFYSLSMVLLGGLGPQGLGFTYSTPKGEVIEICSDIKQNKAIIIKFKKFLKTRFIEKLGKEMKSLHIKEITIKKIVNYLLDALDKKDFISYFKKESILSNIKNFLLDDSGYLNFPENSLKRLVNKVSNAIHAILRPIKMMDQYKARMDLVARGLLKSKDLAKLTSLKEKSHYDILRERVFFQYIIDWFYKIYKNNKKENDNQV